MFNDSQEPGWPCFALFNYVGSVGLAGRKIIKDFLTKLQEKEKTQLKFDLQWSRGHWVFTCLTCPPQMNLNMTC